jgi:non-specific protein-tyrosine kinase
LRHPALHERFELRNERGLADMLTSEATVKQPPLCQTAVTGLSVLTGGTAPSNPLDLLNSRRMSSIISALSAMADIVLFDTPPVTAVSDAAILASQTDGVLLVIQIGKTHREYAQQAKELLNRAHARLIGAVMLNVPHNH